MCWLFSRTKDSIEQKNILVHEWMLMVNFVESVYYGYWDSDKMMSAFLVSWVMDNPAVEIKNMYSKIESVNWILEVRMQVEMENDWQFVDKDYCRMKPICDEKDDEVLAMMDEQNLVN